ncbi:MAG: ROK family protein, partial [Chloroflexota bacterium]|nr:ROK family protein [Chloroflexota bacterium]
MSAQAGTRHLGLDLGGTNVKWAVVEHADGVWQTVDHGQVPTPQPPDPPAVLATLADVGRAALESRHDVRSVGVGVPGLYDPAAGSTRFLPNLGGWRGIPVAEPLVDALGRPVRLINDARAFGLAELRLGAGRGASTMVGLTIGTGVGGVLAIDGRVHLGHDGTAGELGHQTLDPDGPACTCGNRGCLEAFANADAIARACEASGVEEAVTRARAGEERAIRGFREVGRRLGVGLANLVSVLTPDRIVIGGGVAAAADLFLDNVWDQLRLRVHT